MGEEWRHCLRVGCGGMGWGGTWRVGEGGRRESCGIRKVGSIGGRV